MILGRILPNLPQPPMCFSPLCSHMWNLKALPRFGRSACSRSVSLQNRSPTSATAYKHLGNSLHSLVTASASRALQKRPGFAQHSFTRIRLVSENRVAMGLSTLFDGLHSDASLCVDWVPWIDDISHLYRDLQNMYVVGVKHVAKAYKLKVSGRKEAIIERIIREDIRFRSLNHAQATIES